MKDPQNETELADWWRSRWIDPPDEIPYEMLSTLFGPYSNDRHKRNRATAFFSETRYRLHRAWLALTDNEEPPW